MCSSKNSTLVLGGGCFWCVEAAFREIEGIVDIECGYSDGFGENPTYESVCKGDDGWVEVVKINFSQNSIKILDILNIFFAIHNPTELNRQGADIGIQYRSTILWCDKDHKKIIEDFIKDRQKDYNKKIVTIVKECENFHKAEEYHQNYFAKNPQNGYCLFVALPKIEKVREGFGRFCKK